MLSPDVYQGPAPESSADYWNSKFKGVTVTQLPNIGGIANTNGHSFGQIRGKLALSKNSLGHDGLAFAEEQALTAFFILLYRYSSQNDICLAFFSAGKYTDREQKEVFDIILPLRVELNGDDTLNNFAERVNNQLIEAKKSGICFSDVLRFQQAASTKEICNILFCLDAEVEAIQGVTNQFDLVFNLFNADEGPAYFLEFAKNVFDEKAASKFAEHYQNILESISDVDSQKIGELPMLNAEEREEILYVFNDTICEYSAEEKLHSLFEKVANSLPAQVALIQHEKTMSYAELNERSNGLAHHLVANGLRPGQNVALLVTRSFDMIIGMLGILKAGGAYVPIDPEYPVDRQEYILKQSGVNYVLYNTKNGLKKFGTDKVFVDLTELDLTQYGAENLNLTIDSKQLAYTIYTSGSTGVPKGVMIEHHSAVNLVQWVNKEFNVGVEDRLLFITSMCFDLSVYDIFGMLASGGSIVIAERQEVMDMAKLGAMIRAYNITFWDSVPTTLDYLVKVMEAGKKDSKMENIRVVFLSGDWIPVNLPERVMKFFPRASVISLGGATEGTVWSNYYPVKKVQKSWKSIPYGRPIANNFFYILNDQQQPVPIGVAGELYIGGVGVARGYSGDEEKTAYSFVKDPFCSKAGGMMYRTGDLGRMGADMNMEFIGRKDSQVKIRGYRVELGEIESVLAKSGVVQNAVVLAKKDREGVNRLIAYVVPNRMYEQEIAIHHIKTKLPDYMMPAVWVELRELPLTSNGKIDKKALPDVDASYQQKSAFVEASTPQEAQYAAIWKEVLGVERVGVTDNFFNLGGQSLLAVSMLNEIERISNKKLPIAVLFKYPTIKELAKYINEDKAEARWKCLVPIKSTGHKMPVYLIHGDGMNVANFSNLANFMDADQPVYSLQPLGLDELDKPQDNMSDIARYYIKEIMENDPDGPYAIAGYSFGGYVAVEMRQQLIAMGRKVKLLAIFDTNAENTEYTRGWVEKLPRRIRRQVPKFMFIVRSFIADPKEVIGYQKLLLGKKINNVSLKLGIAKPQEAKGLDLNLMRINEAHINAFRNFRLPIFDGKVTLFRAKKRVYFVDDMQTLGWPKYAQKGVDVVAVPGDHKTMFLPPNVQVMARLLQEKLDNC